MGPAYFVIAIMGCADGSQSCTRVSTMPTRYASEQACAASVQSALASNTDLDFPTLVAECRPIAGRPSATQDQRPKIVPAGARRG